MRRIAPGGTPPCRCREAITHRRAAHLLDERDMMLQFTDGHDQLSFAVINLDRRSPTAPILRSAARSSS